MREEYEKLIDNLDKQITMQKNEWESAPAHKQKDWMNKINASLDERLRLMKLRDGKTVEN